MLGRLKSGRSGFRADGLMSDKNAKWWPIKIWNIPEREIKITGFGLGYRFSVEQGTQCLLYDTKLENDN